MLSKNCAKIARQQFVDKTNKINKLRLMPSSHLQHRQYNIVLSCLCWRCEQNCLQDKTMRERKFQNCFFQSRNAA